ncbi:MAG: plastocyanin/azurin family copper-binding protein [Egibacteraceae bacterium]
MHMNVKGLAAGSAMLLALAGCSDGGETSPAENGDAAASTTTVSVDDNVFEPDSVDVSVGDTVTWEWVGTQPHNVRADDFESDLQTEGTFEHTFEEVGTHSYVCTVHPGMEGTVNVAE